MESRQRAQMRRRKVGQLDHKTHNYRLHQPTRTGLPHPCTNWKGYEPWREPNQPMQRMCRGYCYGGFLVPFQMLLRYKLRMVGSMHRLGNRNAAVGPQYMSPFFVSYPAFRSNYSRSYFFVCSFLANCSSFGFLAVPFAVMARCAHLATPPVSAESEHARQPIRVMPPVKVTG